MNRRRMSGQGFLFAAVCAIIKPLTKSAHRTAEWSASAENPHNTSINRAATIENEKGGAVMLYNVRSLGLSGVSGYEVSAEPQ